MSTRFLSLSLFCFWSVLAHGDESPFWRRPEVIQRIENDRYIAVSAKVDTVSKTGTGDVYQMKIVTAGHIGANSEFTYEQLMKFEEYPQVSSNFKELKYDAAKKSLYVHGEALGFHALMFMDLKFQGDVDNRKIMWTVVRGTFQGMNGEIILKSVAPAKTEISMSSLYQSPSLPLPRILMGVGLEIIAHRVAGLMRSHVESRYKGVSKKP